MCVCACGGGGGLEIRKQPADRHILNSWNKAKTTDGLETSAAAKWFGVVLLK